VSGEAIRRRIHEVEAGSPWPEWAREPLQSCSSGCLTRDLASRQGVGAAREKEDLSKRLAPLSPSLRREPRAWHLSTSLPLYLSTALPLYRCKLPSAEIPGQRRAASFRREMFPVSGAMEADIVPRSASIGGDTRTLRGCQLPPWDCIGIWSDGTLHCAAVSSLRQGYADIAGMQASAVTLSRI